MYYHRLELYVLVEVVVSVGPRGRKRGELAPDTAWDAFIPQKRDAFRDRKGRCLIRVRGVAPPMRASSRERLLALSPEERVKRLLAIFGDALLVNGFIPDPKDLKLFPGAQTRSRQNNAGRD